MIRLGDLRRKNGLTQKELSRALNVAQSTLSAWESGKIGIDADSLIDLTSIFGVTAGFILGIEEAPVGNDHGKVEKDGIFVEGDTEKLLLETYRMLSETGRKAVRDYLYYQYTSVEQIPLINAFRRVMEALRQEASILQSLSSAITLVRSFYKSLPPESLRILLDIIIETLRFEVSVPDVAAWSKKQSRYFSKNIIQDTPDFLAALKQKFDNTDFSLDDIISLTEFIRDQFKQLGASIEYLLRIPEVTIRDDVKPIFTSRLLEKAPYYAGQVEMALGCCLDSREE